MKSQKEVHIDNKIIELTEILSPSGNAHKAAKLLLSNDEVQVSQEFANNVSLIRLGYNDHGPVHMKTVTLNAIIMLDLLKKSGIKTTMEADNCGNFEDSLIAVMLSCMLHDIGMGMGRSNHEQHSVILSYPIIEKILTEIFGSNLHKIVAIRSVALEGIAGHMGTLSISSLEAGIVQIADGCDMTKGRARIPIAMAHPPRAGHIHQYSANSIEDVIIKAGNEKPICIEINMSNEAGLFQVEEVLLHKVANSPGKQYIELYATVLNNEQRRYL